MHRVERLPGGVAALVNTVPDDDIPRCLLLLVAAVVDVADLHSAALAETLAHFRDRGAVSPVALAQLRSTQAQHDLDAFVRHRHSDIDGQLASFRRARALDCLVTAFTAAGAHPRETLREVSYEAAAAMGGSAGVVAVLAGFTA